MQKEGAIYFKMEVSYGEPTEFDQQGCDGMFIKSIEKTDVIAKLEAVARQGEELESWLDTSPYSNFEEHIEAIKRFRKALKEAEGLY